MSLFEDLPEHLREFLHLPTHTGRITQSPLTTFNHWCVAVSLQTKGGVTVEYLHKLPIPQALELINTTVEVLEEIQSQTQKAIEKSSRK